VVLPASGQRGGISRLDVEFEGKVWCGGGSAADAPTRPWTERIEGCRSAEVLLQLVSGREERDGVSGSRVALCKAPRSCTSYSVTQASIARKARKTQRGRERDPVFGCAVEVASCWTGKGNRACHERPVLLAFLSFCSDGAPRCGGRHARRRSRTSDRLSSRPFPRF
jgi:hypothetical protein